MNSRERILAHLAGQPVDRLPLMPITMLFACDQHRREVSRLLTPTIACWSKARCAWPSSSASIT